MPPSFPLRLGTRASTLARWQADWVAGRLAELGVHVELVPITTSGDSRQTDPLSELGSTGVFTKEIQFALLDGQIDLAVHSLKDLPTDAIDGLTLACVPSREVPFDVLVTSAGTGLDDLAEASVVGTGSLRRQAQLLHVRPDLVMKHIRGNVDSRLRKLDEGEYDAIVLAEAGLKRLGLTGRASQVLTPPIMLPAVGQGALGIETRSDDRRTQEALSTLEDPASRQAVVAERAMLAHLRGGCLAPVGAWGRVEDGSLRLSGTVLSNDGRQKLDAEASAGTREAAELGRRVAERLIEQGAAEIVASG